MKKTFASFLIGFCAMMLPLFADSKNIVSTQNFDALSVDTLEISLIYEDLKITQIYGDEISVEIGTNNIKKVPEVICEDGVLRIKSKEKKATRGNNCTVYLYLPQDLNLMSITINNASGNIQADILKAQNFVRLGNVSGRVDIASCTTELYNLTTVSGNATLQKVTVEYFDFSSTSGNIFAELSSAPLAASGITNVSGKSQLYVPKDSTLSFATFSVSGTITNNITTRKTSTAPQITLSSVSGKIEVREY